jgi:hypothetical protein
LHAYLYHHRKRQILHVWAQSEAIAETVAAEFNETEEELRGNTILLITVSRNSDFIFFEHAVGGRPLDALLPPPPHGSASALPGARTSCVLYPASI